jgi:tetratricopeptide (TPR) repeat protein
MARSSVTNGKAFPMRNLRRISWYVFQRLLICQAVLLATVTVAVAAAPVAGAPPPATAPAGVSEADRQAIAAARKLGALKKDDKTVPYSEKVQQAREVSEGVEAVIAAIEDPDQLMQIAAAIKEYGVDQDVNTLEYLGEDPATQGHLKPLSSAVLKLLGAASKAAEERVDQIANQLNLNVPQNAQAWQAMDDLAHTAAYSRNMAVYSDCIATSAAVCLDPNTKAVLAPEQVRQRKANHEQIITLRKSMADEAIAALKEFDDHDSEVQARIRNMLAKLHMAAGEYKEARKIFRSVYRIPTDVLPRPNAFEQYDARYFSVVAEVLEGDLAKAKKGKRRLDAWQTQTLPGMADVVKLDGTALKACNDGIAMAADMLQWRIAVLEGELAPTAAARNRADADAEAIMIRMHAAYPLQTARIDQQLASRVNIEKIDAAMPSTLLLALVKNGMSETYKTEPEKPDEAIVQKAIQAAYIIVDGKKSDANEVHPFTAQNIAESKLSLAALEESLGHDVQAADHYLDYALDHHALDPTKADDAFQHAGYLVFTKMGKLRDKPQGYQFLYQRFLRAAVNPPFNRANLAYYYAELLLDQKEFRLAVKYYRLAPKENPAYPRIDHKIMLTLEKALDPDNGTVLTGADRKETIAELKTVAERVKKLGKISNGLNERKWGAEAEAILADLAQRERADQEAK